MAPSVRRWLLVCYTCEVMALAVWTGGLLVIVGSVIPAVFNSFGMEAGGRFLTRVFDGYNRFVLAAIALLVAAGAGRAWIAARYQFTRHASLHVEMVLLGLMIAVALTIILWLGPVSVSMQEAAFAVKDEAGKKPAYDAFFKA
ncbi:MAG TPA: DUF4149 domain-containing protein, partial [Nitrospiraceae bacterium]|nr:DUF4149 domain-containing protein [Nitrospiraceae bacterium]